MVPRFCVKCGYDISTVLGEGRRHQCPECGRVGRGLPPPPGMGWPIRRAAVRSIKWAVLVVVLFGGQDLLAPHPNLVNSGWVRFVVFVLTIALCCGLISMVTDGVESAERWGKWRLPEAWRRGRVPLSAVVSTVVNVGILCLAYVVTLGFTWLTKR